MRRAGGLQTFPGCTEPGPALWHLHAHGKQVLWPTGQQETPIKKRSRASGKGVISVELFIDHTTLCSYVPWGRGGCPQATIAGVKYSPSEHLVRGASWKVPSILLWESRWKRELKIKRCLTPVTQMVLHYYKASTLWWDRTGDTPLLTF